MITPPQGFDITDSEDPDDRDMLRFLKERFRQVVCLAFGVQRRVMTGVREKDAGLRFCSGFILEVQSRWYWVTAGHILEEIQEVIESSDQDADAFRLIDSFGSDPVDTTPIPFNFEGAWKWFEHDDGLGLDYGAVALGELEKRNLQKNIVPVSARDWKNLNSQSFREFFVLGFPTDSITPRYIDRPGGYSIFAKPKPSVVSMVKTAPQGSPTTFPRLYGKLSENWPKGGMAGFSGGPIVGLADDGRFRVIAVQSGWLGESRIAFACPFDVFGPRLLKQIKQRDRIAAKKKVSKATKRGNRRR